MRIKKGFRLRDIMGQATVIGEGAEQVDFNKLVTLNPTAAYLWENVAGKDFTVETLVGLLTEKYDVDIELASKDAADLVEKWKNIGLVE